MLMDVDDYVFRESELEQAAKKAGVQECAINDILMRRDEFEVVGGSVVHKASHQSAFDHINVKWRAEKPHLFPSPYSVDTADRAFGLDGQKPDLTMQGRLVKEIGLREAEQLAKKFGTKLGSLTPGRLPQDAPPAEKKRVDSTNPWAAAKLDPEAAAGIIRRLGTRAAAGMARACNKTIGGAPIRQ